MEQFTASEIRDAITWKYGDKSTRISAMLNAFADLLEAREKAKPVMIVNHVSSAEHDLPIGMKLYTHPSPAYAERLGELRCILRNAMTQGDARVIGKDELKRALEILADLSAQAQPPAASVPEAPNYPPKMRYTTGQQT